MTGRIAVHAALTARQRAELNARAQAATLPRARYPLLAYAVQRVVRGRGASGSYLGGHVWTLIRHNLQTADAKAAARAALLKRGGTPIVFTEVRTDGRQHDAPGR